MEQAIVKCLSEGMTREATADVCGIHRDTLREWMNAAEGEFSASLKRAESEAERVLLGRIHEASMTPAKEATAWQAAAWILERRFRERWGRHERHDVNVTRQPGDDLTDEQRIAVYEAAIADLKAKAG